MTFRSAPSSHPPFPARRRLLPLAAALTLAGCSPQASNEPARPDVSSEGSTAPPAAAVDEGPAVESVPFGLPSGPAGRDAATAPLFEKIDAAGAGIDFLHVWEPASDYEAKLLRTGFTGGGCALGDYDGDGDLDVVLTRPYGGARLFRNLGDLRFEDATADAGLEDDRRFATGAAFADLDRDGDLDLHLCRYNWYNSVYRNNGDGTFTDVARESGLVSVGANVKAVFADYDLDGDLDAFLVTNRLEPLVEREPQYEGEPGNYRPTREFEELVGVINLPDGRQQFVKAGQFDRLFRNELSESGALKFTDVSREAGITGNYHGLDAIWCDFNADRHPDLYVCNDFTDPDQLLRNNGDGTFTDITLEALPHLPWFSMAACSEDLDGDLLLDLMAADMAATTHYREKMSMGAMDAVAWFLDTAEPRQYMRNALYLNSGTPRFREAAFLAGLARTNWTWSLKAADFDLDGRIDVLATNGFTRDYMHSDFAADLAERGLQGDAAAWLGAPELREQNLIFRNEGNLTFTESSGAWGLPGESDISFGAACGDLDGDGDGDLLVDRFGEQPLILRNHSQVGGRLEIRLRGTASNRDGIGAIVTVEAGGSSQVRALHPGTGFMSSDAPTLLFGIGDAPRADMVTVTWPSGVRQEVANLAPGHRHTITEPAVQPAPVSAEPSSPAPLFQASDVLAAAVHHEAPFDDFARQPLLPNRLSQLGPGSAWADVDRDGDLDFFVGGAAGQAGQLFLRQPDGGFVPVEVPALAADAGSEDMGCVFLDADADGDPDLFVVSGGVECEAEAEVLRDRLYRNDSSAEGIAFSRMDDALPDLRDSGGPVAAADFDRDGDLDLFVGGRTIPGAYPLTPRSRLLRNDGGTFVDATSESGADASEAGMVTAALWSDVDSDGWVDLLLALEYDSPRLFRNAQGTLVDATEEAGLASLKGWWNSLAACDFDLDGDLDYVAGNLGLNTKYHPSPEKPQLLYYGDFEGSGTPHIVEAKFSADGVLPTRGRSCSSSAMPFLREKFPTYQQFATARLDEIYQPDRLSSAFRLEAGVVESGVLVNDGRGAFTFTPLPRIAQIAPVFGVAVLHANADAWPDLFLAQNFFTPQRETGRMDGGVGQLLLGAEGGQWSAVRPDASGIVIAGDGAGATTVDLNGDGHDDLVVTVNNGPVRAFLRASEPGGDAPAPTPIVLTGPPTNPESIGAQLRLHLPDGRIATQESSAGSGYLAGWAQPARIPPLPVGTPVRIEVRWPDGESTESNALSGTTVHLPSTETAR